MGFGFWDWDWFEIRFGFGVLVYRLIFKGSIEKTEKLRNSKNVFFHNFLTLIISCLFQRDWVWDLGLGIGF